MESSISRSEVSASLAQDSGATAAEVDDGEQYEEEEEYYEDEEEEEYEEGDEEEVGAESQEIYDSTSAANDSMALGANDSWTSKINNAQGAGSSMEGLDRCTTPLRPDDGMVDRVSAAERAKKLLSTSTNSVMGAVKLKSGQRVPRLRKAKADPLKALKQAFPEIDSARALKGDLPPEEDAYSLHEKDIATELNMARGSPSQYAKLMANVVLVGTPFVDASVGKVTFAQLKAHLEGATADVNELQSSLDALEESENKEVTALKDQWAIEDAEKAKKNKKAPPKKPKGDDKVVDEAALAAAALEAEREAAVRAISEVNEENRSKLLTGINSAKTKRENAANGVAVLQQCFQKLESLPTLPPVRYSRGLSLAARDICTVAAQNVPPADVCARYGSFPTPEDPTVVSHSGVASIRQTVMEMLLCLNDPKRKGRARMLDPAATVVGVGWRRESHNGNSKTVLLFANLFEDLEAISSREHMPLQDVRRILQDALKVSSRTTLVLRDPSVSVISPSSHPLVCATGAVVSLNVPVHLDVSAALHHQRDPPPKAPAYFTGELFIQRVTPEQVDIHVALPFQGQFVLALFTSVTPGTAGPAAASHVGFKQLGIVKLHSDDWHISKRGVDSPAAYPISSSNFSERRACLISPLNGQLTANCRYVFEIDIPLTQYLVHEQERINNNLAEATKVSSGSREKGQELQEAADRTAAAVEEAIAYKEKTGAQLQQDIATLLKEQQKKRGKELEKNKVQVAELENQLKALDVEVEKVKVEAAAATERILAHRRTTRQASAQRRRFLTEQAQIAQLTDRSKPLDVELSLDERRSKLFPVNDEFTRYSAEVTAPKGGQVCLFIGGIAALTWNVIP